MDGSSARETWQSWKITCRPRAWSVSAVKTSNVGARRKGGKDRAHLSRAGLLWRGVIDVRAHLARHLANVPFLTANHRLEISRISWNLHLASSSSDKIVYISNGREQVLRREVRNSSFDAWCCIFQRFHRHFIHLMIDTHTGYHLLFAHDACSSVKSL